MMGRICGCDNGMKKHAMKFVKKPLKERNDETPRASGSEDNITTDSMSTLQGREKKAGSCPLVCVCV